MTDITILKRALESKVLQVCEHLLPAGKLEAGEWCVGSISGEAGHSLKVRVKGAKAGRWADFEPGGESGDLVDLWGAVTHKTLAESLDEIRSWLGIEKPKFERADREWHRPAKPKCTVPNGPVLAYLTGDRKITQDAINAYRVAEQGRAIVFPFVLPDGSLPMVKVRKLDLVNGKKDIRLTEAGCEPVLFGWPAINPEAREITLVEGEIDALTSWDYGHPALSVPFGGGKGAKQQWIESEFDRLSRFERIYLATDMDEAGNEAAEEIANRLGRHRCFRVSLPHKDLNECRQKGVGQSEIDQCFKAAASLDPPELRRAGEYTDAVCHLFWPAHEEGRNPRVLPFAKAGGLEFRPAELTVWTGPAGSGKSQLLSHACVAWGDQGARICMASLEMNPPQFLRRMVKQATNLDRPTDQFIRTTMAWIDQWLWVFGVVGKAKTDRLLDVFEYARARYGCDTFVIDSLMRLGISPEDYEAQEKAIFEIVSWTVEKNVHMHLVAHARKGDGKSFSVPETEDIKGTSEIGANAFNILSVWRNRKHEDELKAAETVAEKGNLQAQDKVRELQAKPGVILNVAKQRNGDWEGKIGLWFSQATYQYRSAHDSPAGRQYVTFRNGRENAA